MAAQETGTPRLSRLLLAALLLLSSFCSSHGDAEKLPSWVSFPTRPATVPQYYSPTDLFNCDGANFSHTWAVYRRDVAENAAAGFPMDRDLFRRASKIVTEQEPGLDAASLKLPHVLLKQMPVSRLEGFCLFGYAASLFIVYRHTLLPTYLETIERTLGWNEWPLDFMESSGWPNIWTAVMLHLEKARGRGDGSWSGEMQRWGEEAQMLPRPDALEVEDTLMDWLQAVAGRTGSSLESSWRPSLQMRTGYATPSRALAKLAARGGGVWMQVLGHHMGSSMEPFSMLREALKVGFKLEVEASFVGQRHPSPGLVCKEFGYCGQSPELEAWFKRYEGRWLSEYEWMPEKWDEALESLTAIIGSSLFMQRADLVVCGGPAWFCAMLRSVWLAPMLLYFAWPIASLVPAGFKTHVFSIIRSMGQSASPPTVIVVANRILAAQFALQIHMPVEVQRPHGLYANATYSPVPAADGRPRVMITRIGQWARVSGVALLETTWSFMEQKKRETGRVFPLALEFLSIRIRGTNTNKALTYKEFAGYHACVFWPWDVMMLLFNELYTMTVPLLIPDRSWMVRLMAHSLRHTEMNWWHMRGATVAGELPRAFGPEYPLPSKPWADGQTSIEALSYWYELTDFVQFPSITNFHSLPDMLDKLESLDVAAVRAGMSAYNHRTLRQSLAFYREAATELLV